MPQFPSGCALSLQLLYSSVIFDRACKLHIGNLADLQTLVKGSSQPLDLVHLSIVDVGEKFAGSSTSHHPQTADGGSRSGPRDPVAKSLGLTLRRTRNPGFLLGLLQKGFRGMLDMWP